MGIKHAVFVVSSPDMNLNACSLLLFTPKRNLIENKGVSRRSRRCFSSSHQVWHLFGSLYWYFNIKHNRFRYTSKKQAHTEPYMHCIRLSVVKQGSEKEEEIVRSSNDNHVACSKNCFKRNQSLTELFAHGHGKFGGRMIVSAQLDTRYCSN